VSTRKERSFGAPQGDLVPETSEEGVGKTEQPNEGDQLVDTGKKTVWCPTQLEDLFIRWRQKAGQKDRAMGGKR